MAIKGGKWEMSDEEFEQEYAEATRRGKAEAESSEYALAARYDKSSRRVVIDLANGTTLLVPARLIQGLRKAAQGKLSEIEILGAGSGLYWPKLQVDIGMARIADRSRRGEITANVRRGIIAIGGKFYVNGKIQRWFGD
jgi:hypothetical protein